MARTPVRQISYMVCWHDEDEGIPFLPVGKLGGHHSSKRKAMQDFRHTRKQYSDVFLVKVTEERLEA